MCFSAYYASRLISHFQLPYSKPPNDLANNCDNYFVQETVCIITNEWLDVPFSSQPLDGEMTMRPKITRAHAQTLLCVRVICAPLLTSACVESSPASRPRHNTTRPNSAQKYEHTLSTSWYGQYGLRMCPAISSGQWQVGIADLSSLGRIRKVLSPRRKVSLEITAFPSVNCRGEAKAPL